MRVSGNSIWHLENWHRHVLKPCEQPVYDQLAVVLTTKNLNGFSLNRAFNSMQGHMRAT
jgi:hypothetical protein